MIFPIFFALVGAYFGWNELAGAENFFETEQYILKATIIVCIGTLGAMLGFFLSLIMGSLVKRRWSQPTVSQLYGMRTDGVGGLSYLTRHSIDGGWAYNYYIWEGDQLRPQSLPIKENDILITQTHEMEPRLEVSVLELPFGWLKFFTISSAERRYRFTVPEDSVSVNFVL